MGDPRTKSRNIRLAGKKETPKHVGNFIDELDNLISEAERVNKMLLSEQYARLKTCCVSQTSERCVASDCMAWRWKPALTIDDGRQEVKTERGYCGMAGKPER